MREHQGVKRSLNMKTLQQAVLKKHVRLLDQKITILTRDVTLLFSLVVQFFALPMWKVASTLFVNW